MTYSRRSLKHIAYYALLLVLLMVVGSSSAFAQPSVPPPIAGGGPTDFEDPNPKTPFDTRDDYFKRFPFARNAFDHDNKEVHEWSTRVVEGPPEPGFFDNITDIISNIGSSIGNALGFGGSSGGNSSSNTNQSPETRSQHSMPEEGASGPVHVTAYPFFIKFCNDNPYQGICYWQAGEAFDRPRTDRDLELFENVLTTFGYPVSDTQFQLIQRENFQRLLELMYDPERYVWMATNTSQMQAASAANSLAGVSEQAFVQMVAFILDGHNGNDGLLNVANENAATAMNLNALYRPVSAAYDVVMRSYKEIYVPMAILFLLPGAVITQVKATVSKGFDLGDGNPFEGIIRSMVAIFLIPGTQVIVSYSIDVGNSMATTAEDWVDRGLIIDWQHELTYNVNPQDNHKNVIEPPEVDDGQELRQVVFEGQNGEGGDDNIVTGNPNAAAGGGGAIGSIINFFSTVLSWLAGTFDIGVFGSGGEGLGANVPEADTTQEEQLALSQVMQVLFNGATFVGALTIIILTAAQVVLICYMFLLGPLSAAFFAWPQLGKQLFRGVFSNWLYAVIMVSLWRFYWVVGLVLMTQRLLYINNPAGVHLGTGDLQWEVAIFICILALMIWTSMNPFSYDPKAAFEFVEKFMEQAQGAGEALQEGAGGGGGAGGAGGQGSDSSQPSSGGGVSDNSTDSPGGSTDGRSDQDANPTDTAADRVESSSGDDPAGTGEDASGSGGADSESRTESMANDSPPDSNAPPMESGGGGGSGGGQDTPAPPSAQTDAMMAGGAAAVAASAGGGGGDEESSVAGDAVASSGFEARQMPEDSAPVDRSPGEGNAQTGNYNQDADASQAQAGIASQTMSTGDSDSSGSGGSPSSPGEMNMTIGQEGDDSGGSSESPQPPNLGNIQPPPMSDSSDDE